MDPDASAREIPFHIDDGEIQWLDCFLYLGIILSASCGFDYKIQYHIRQAAVIFGKLSGGIFLNKDLPTKLKVMVSIAICLSIHLCGTEVCIIYSRGVKLKSFRGPIMHLVLVSRAINF